MNDNGKAARTKSKMILKKSRPSVPVHNLYKKKSITGHSIKTPSAHTLQSLRASNKLLSESLEKMRRDFQQMHEQYSQLLERNQQLKEYVIRLKQYHIPENLIEMEINKKVKERLGNVEKKLCVLNSLATEFVETISELSETCVCILSPQTAECSRLTNCSFSLPTDKQFLSADVSLAGGTRSASAHIGKKNEDETTDNGFHLSSALRRHSLGEKVNWKQLSKDNKSSPINDDSFESIKSASEVIRKHNPVPEFHVNFQKQIREPNKCSREPLRKAVTKVNKRTRVNATDKLQRLETFVIASEEFPNNEIISDIVRPQFLLVNDDENEWIDNDAESSEYISHESAVPLTNYSMGKMPKRKHGFQSEDKSKLITVSSQEELSPLVFQYEVKQMPSETYQPYQNSTWINMTNVRKQNLEKDGNKANYVTTIQRCLPFHQTEKHSVFPEDVTEEPETLENNLIKHVGLSSKATPVGSIDNIDKMESYLSKTRHQKKNELKEHTVREATVDNFTDALITRLPCPDHLANTYKQRQEPNGIYKNDPVMHHKVRSSSKRLKTRTMINFLKKNQQSNFDLKNKSPKVLNVEMPKCTKESSLSKPIILGKNRSSSSNADEASHSMSSTEVESSSIDKKISFFSEDSENDILFKRSSPMVESNYLNGSQSRDKMYNERKNSKGKIRKNIPNEIAWVQSDEGSTKCIKMDCISKSLKSCQEQPFNKSEYEIVNHCNRPVDSTELVSEDSCSECIMADRHVTSDSICTQGKLNSLGSEEKVKLGNQVAQETTTNLFNHGSKTQRKIYIDRMTMKQNTTHHILSIGDRNVKKCDALLQSFPAVKLEDEKLGEEKVTKDFIASFMSGIKYDANSSKLKKLMQKIKHKSLVVSSHSDTKMLNSETILHESSDPPKKSLFVGMSTSHDQSEGKIAYIDGNRVVKSHSKSIVPTTKTHPDNPSGSRKIIRNRFISIKSREMSQDDSEIFLKCANSTANRIEKTRNKERGRRISGSTESINKCICRDASEEDHATDSDYVSKTYSEVLLDEADIDIMIFSESEPKQLLKKLSFTRSAKLSRSDESMQSETMLNGNCYNALEKQGQHSRMFQIVPFLHLPSRSLSPSTKPTPTNLGRTNQHYGVFNTT